MLFDGVQVPHYNYVGDSILGYKAHTGAGAITSNLKSDKKLVTVMCDGEKVETVSYQAVEENDFNLSVNIYIPQDEKEKEVIDPSVLENKARRSFLERLRKELDFDKMVCEMEGVSMQPFINSIRAVLREYDTRKAIYKDENQLSLFDIGA